MTKYYKEIDSQNRLISFGSTEYPSIPKTCVELTEEEYDALVQAVQDERKQEEERLATEAKTKREEYEAQIRAEQEKKEAHDTKVKTYVNAIKSGEKKLSDVPEDLKEEVNNILNPPIPLSDQIKDALKQISTCSDAIQFLMSAQVNDTEDETASASATDNNK